MPDRWGQIEDLYHRASELDKSQRGTFLKVACAGDDSLRREVESLLRHESGAESLMQEPAIDLTAQSLAGERHHGREGQRIGHYTILSLLGTGGMGEVYRARDAKLNRDVAIKFLSSEAANAESLRRFRREAQTASSLNHPHILTVHEVGELEGLQYLVTEFVDGGTLNDWLSPDMNHARRTWRQVVELLTGVADGLAAAHAATILHRDVKPENT
jgi:eukaryotic-like serine/threonine-protein kinase